MSHMSAALLCCLAGLLSCVPAGGQTRPDFSGVWKLHRETSKTAGPGPQSLLMLVEYQGSRLRQRLLGIEADGREQRMEFAFDVGGAETLNNLRGVMVKSRTRWDGDTLVVDSAFRVSQPPMDVNVEDRMYLSADGSVFSLDRLMRRKPADRQAVEMREALRFVRGSAEDLAMLNRPEKTAGETYRNVQALRALPASKLTELMLGYQQALGVGCDHCHVPNEWDRDDKQSKQIARRMILMTDAINRDHLAAAQSKVDCRTCHRGRPRPE